MNNHPKIAAKNTTKENSLIGLVGCAFVRIEKMPKTVRKSVAGTKSIMLMYA
jgi:hypothetical protein